MKTEVDIKTALYSVLQDAPIETVIRCLADVCHDVELQQKQAEGGTPEIWAKYGDKLMVIV